MGSPLDCFLADRRARGVCAGTERWYRGCLTVWLAVRPDITAFLEHYRTDASRQTAYRAARIFERATGGTALPPRRFAPAPEYPLISQEEFERILAQLGDSYPDRRDGLVYRLLWATGARLNAIRCLRPGDCDLAAGNLWVRTKGRVVAEIVLPRGAAFDLLREWLRTAGEWVFPSSAHPGKPIDASWLSHRFPRLARAAGISKRCWVHGLRHAAATGWVDAGVPLELVQRQMLHRAISTTQRYARTSLARVRAALETA